MPKNMTLRLPDDQATMLEMVARADGQTTTDAVRTAIDKHIEARRADSEFQRRLTTLVDQEREVLDRLAR